MQFKLKLALLLSLFIQLILTQKEKQVHTTTSQHTNNWAVLVSASRFWFNYRHLSNAISIYRTIKRLGIPDSNIILMLADDIACNPRNKYAAQVFRDVNNVDLYQDNIEVDYKGYDVTVENFVRVLTNRWDENTPKSKRLLSDKNSNVLVYLTGHGGENFLKFQDSSEITSSEIADSFMQMQRKQRFNELLFIIDTCEANSLYSKIEADNVIALGSSEIGGKSYAHGNHADLGVSVIEKLTHYTLEFMKDIHIDSTTKLKTLFDSYNPDLLWSTPGLKYKLGRNFEDVLITDFFGAKQVVQITNDQHINQINSSNIQFQPYTPIIERHEVEDVSINWLDKLKMIFNLQNNELLKTFNLSLFTYPSFGLSTTWLNMLFGTNHFNIQFFGLTTLLIVPLIIALLI